MMNDPLGYYEILGVSFDANEQTIKRNYRDRAKLWHPDSNPDMDTMENFQKLSVANDIVSDEKNRLTDVQMETLEEEINNVLDKLKLILADIDAQDKPEPADKEKIMNLFEQLELMLMNSNPECINLLDDIHTIPGTEELAQYIVNFEFEQAVMVLEKIKRTSHEIKVQGGNFEKHNRCD